MGAMGHVPMSPRPSREELDLREVRLQCGPSTPRQPWEVNGHHAPGGDRAKLATEEGYLPDEGESDAKAEGVGARAEGLDQGPKGRTLIVTGAPQ
jgi:hypothetical protein